MANNQMVTFHAKIDGMPELIKEMRARGINVKRAVRKAIRAGGKVIQDDAELRVDPKLRKAKKSIVMEVSIPNSTKGDVVQALIHPGKRAKLLNIYETGATAHEIHATKSPFMVFEMPSGSVIRTRSVHHPGVAARPFLRPALDAKSRDAVAIVAKELKIAATTPVVAKGKK